MAVYVDTATAQFENVNELRKYPFVDTATFVDTQGAEISAGLVADVGLVVPAEIGLVVPEDGVVNNTSQPESPVVKMTSIHLSSAMVSVCFQAVFNGKMSALSVTVGSSVFRPYFPYRLEKLYGSEDVGGVVSFGDIKFPNYPETHRLENAIVHPSCIAMAKPASLRSLVDLRSGLSIFGDVRIAFSGYVEASAGDDSKSIQLSLAEGAESALASDCIDMDGEDPCGATSIRSINGVSPDEDGNIVLWFH